MNEMTLEYPESWLAAMGLNEADFAEETRMAAAMKLFERGRFSSGQAAQFAGIPRIEFLLNCRRWGVNSVSWDDSDLAAEFSTQLPPKG
jgi:predicted HTH domain antitoxin